MNRVFILLFLVVGFGTLSAQTSFQPRKLSNNGKGIVYNKEVTGDLRLQTDGWAIGMTFGKLKSYDLTQFIYGGIGELRHPREVWTNDIQHRGRYVFGKQNNLYVLRAGWGQKHYFSEKAKRKGAAVGMVYQVGPSIGFVKPYYLSVAIPESRTMDTRAIRFTPATTNEFLDKERIRGGGGFLRGWDNLSLAPGVQAIIAAHFDWGAFDQNVKALEAGIMLDLYFQAIPLMVEVERFDNLKNQPLFLNFFINLQLGKRS
ncbi:MAG: hypothetical protein AAF738_11905 [Bacteroidota bacterium]